MENETKNWLPAKLLEEEDDDDVNDNVEKRNEGTIKRMRWWVG